MASAPTPRRRIRPAAARSAPQAVAHPHPEPVAVETVDDRWVGPRPEELATMTIRQRIEMIAQYDPEAAEELAINTVNQYMITHTPIDVTAARMGYSIGWVDKIRRKIRQRFKEQCEQLDIKQTTMTMLDQLKEMAAIGMRDAAAAKPADYQRRLSGVNSARHAIQDQVKLLHVGGAFETAPLKPSLVSTEDSEPANVLKELARNFLTGRYHPSSTSIRPGDVIIDNEDAG